MPEPFDLENPNRQPVPAGSFLTITRRGLTVRPFEPDAARLALTG